MLKKFAIIIYVFLSSFSFSYASLEISEIMYNPEGTDTNREWVEIHNIGSAIDIENWYFFENDTYHGLVPDGFSRLEGGERALIVKDVASAKSALGSGLKYIKSSFSLKNTGESLVVANTDKTHIDSYTYSPETGANGDGKSLQLVASSWIAGTPTPGKKNSSNQGNTSQDNSNNADSAETSNNSETTRTYANPHYRIELNVPDVIVAQSNFKYIGEAFYIKKGKETRELDGFYYINFGNGDYIESRKRIENNYRYRNSGNYIVIFEYYSSKLLFDNGDDPDASIKKIINVSSHDLEIIDVNHFDGVVIENKTEKTIDLSNWKIIWENNIYEFPRLSYLSPHNKTNIISRTLGFLPLVSKDRPVQLFSNAYKPVSHFPKLVKRKKYIKKNLVKSSLKNTKSSGEDNLQKRSQNTLDFDSLEDVKSDFFGNSKDSYLEDYLDNNPSKLKVDFGEKNNFAVNKERDHKNNSPYYVLAAFVLMLGAGRFTKHRKGKEHSAKTEDFGTIEIIE